MKLTDDSLTNYIPVKYFCNWTFIADPSSIYLMTIQRYSQFGLESLMLSLFSKTVDNYTDSSLASNAASTVQYKILSINRLAIYALNSLIQSNSTFMITLQTQGDSSSGGSVFGTISLVLFILLGVFVLICSAAIIRVCIRKRRNV